MPVRIFIFRKAKRKGGNMIIISSLTYPAESAKDMAKRFLEAPALPNYITRRGPYVSSSREDGVLTMSLYELDNSKLAEGMQAVSNYLATFFGVPGFKYEISPYFEISEALKTIGMK